MKAKMKMRMVAAVMDGRRMMTMAAAEMIMMRRLMNSFSRVARTLDRQWMEKLMMRA